MLVGHLPTGNLPSRALPGAKIRCARLGPEYRNRLLDDLGTGMDLRVANFDADPVVFLIAAEELLDRYVTMLRGNRPTYAVGGKKSSGNRSRGGSRIGHCAD